MRQGSPYSEHGTVDFMSLTTHDQNTEEFESIFTG